MTNDYKAIAGKLAALLREIEIIEMNGVYSCRCYAPELFNISRDEALTAFNEMGDGDADLYYIMAKSKGFVGNLNLWWCPKSQGYTCYISKAGKYSFDEAKDICKDYDDEIAYPCSYIDSMLQTAVDSQWLDRGKIVDFSLPQPPLKNQNGE